MNIDYSDILTRLGEPLWYDENAVPRYVEFHPDHCGVYAEDVALMVIHCQNCRKPMTVACAKRRRKDGYYPDKSQLDPWGQSGEFFYRDPPRHGCTGDTMLCTPVEIVQFWSQSKDGVWFRNLEYEFALAPDTE